MRLWQTQRGRRMAGGKELKVAWCLLYCLLQLCSALSFPCTARQDGENTIYNVDGEAFGANTADCDYSWANGNGTALANHKEALASVVTNRIHTLVISKCFDKMTLTWTCDSEGLQHTSTCMTNCSEKAVPRKAENEHNLAWIAVIPIGLLLLVVLVGCICYMRSLNKEPGSCSGQKEGSYSSVNMLNSRDDDVEAVNK